MGPLILFLLNMPLVMVYTKHTAENLVIDLKSLSKLTCAVTLYAYFLGGAGSDLRIVEPHSDIN